MEERKRTFGSPSTEITREELANVAYMCYILNRTWTTRWVRRWNTALEKMTGKGWTWEGFHYRGLVRNKLEELYGLTPRESRAAVEAYPQVNLGLEPWQVFTDANANDLAEQIYRAYVGLPAEKRRSFWSVPSHDGGDTSCEGCDESYNAPPSFVDGSDMGGLFNEQ